MQLRGYQSEAIAGIAAAHRGGHQGALLVCPTGGGKTVIYSAITRGLVAAGRYVLIIEPGVELVEQTRDKLARLGVQPVGIIAAGWGAGYNPHPHARVQVATVQTLRSRPEAVLATPDYIIIDEAHLSSAPSYRAILERYSYARRLGVTATPKRLDGDGFTDLASRIVVACDVVDLLRSGALTPFRTRSFDMTKFSGLGRGRKTEFSRRDVEKAFNERRLVGDVVQHYLDSDKAGRSGIVFGSGRAHAQQLAEQFGSAGIRTEYLDGATPLELRRAMLRRLETGETTIVCNYGVLTAGFDCPRIEYVGIARATASWALWRQMAGRGLRPSPDTGKVDCLVDDFGGNALRHGNLAHPTLRCASCALASAMCDACEQDVLDGRPRAEREDVEGLGKACDTCRVVVDADASCCPHCGADFVVAAERAAARRARKDRGPVDGRLTLIDGDAAPLSPEEKAERAAEKAKRSGAYLRRTAIEKARAFGASWGAS